MSATSLAQMWWFNKIQDTTETDFLLSSESSANISDIKIKVLSYIAYASAEIVTLETERDLMNILNPLSKLWINFENYIGGNSYRINNLLSEYAWLKLLIGNVEKNEWNEVLIDWFPVSNVLEWMDVVIQKFVTAFITRVNQIIEKRKMVRSLEESKIKIVKLEKELTVDYLTNAQNKKAYDTLLSNAYYLFMNNKLERISVMLIDMDKFKFINDTFWHWAWDYVLKKFSKIMNQYAIKYKWEFCRLWWEEFWFIFQNKTSEEVAAIWEEIQEDLITNVMLEDSETLTDCRLSITWWIATIDHTNKDKYERAWQVTKMADNWTYVWKWEWRKTIKINEWTPNRNLDMRTYNVTSSNIDINKIKKWVWLFLPDLLVAMFWNQKEIVSKNNPIFNLPWISSAHINYAYLVYKVLEEKGYWDYEWMKNPLKKFLNEFLNINNKTPIFNKMDALLEVWNIWNDLKEVVIKSKKYKHCPYVDAFLDYLFS